MTDDELAAREAYFARELSEDELDALMFRARRPGIMLNKTKYADDPGTPGSWLGGDPTLPPEIEWPISRGQDFKTPMHFLAQINLAHLPRMSAHPEMPRSGTMFFFADMIYGPGAGFGFGMNPDVRRRYHRVIYVAENVSLAPCRKPPPMPEPAGDQFYWYREAPHSSYGRWNFDFLFFEGFVRPRHVHPALNMRITDALIALTSNRLIEGIRHSEFEMLWKQTEDRRSGLDQNACQVFRPHHLFGSIGAAEPKGLTRLFALGTDKDLVFNNDGHWVVFWIAKADLEALNFAETECCTEFS